ncbi:flavoprotein [Streptomyces albogriseolus]|uniref:flavoprotein n=1 Tax=Streptomyces albogriseolus TaxID=1887 RepID=UPI003CEF92FC
MNMVRNTVDQLSGSYDQRSPRYLAAVGLLLLRGATAASRNGDRETTWRSPGEPRPSRPADAIAVAPATFNTVNKWAAGISDNLALGILCEAPALGVPVAVLPYLNSAQAAHPAYRRSLDLLCEMGVLIGSYEPHRPKAGGGADRYRWEEVLELLDPRLSARS